MSVKTYYPTIPVVARRMDTLGRQMGFRAETVEEYNIWAAALRGRLVSSIGLDKMVPCELAPREVERMEIEGGITRVKYLINTEPDVVMPFYMLIPPGAAIKCPAIICPHGHGSGGKISVAGDVVIPEVAGAIKKYNYDYGIQLARQGFITLCPDARGFGERREVRWQGDTPEHIMANSCAIINTIALMMGQSLCAMWVWDLMRLIDFAQTLPFVDSEKIGCAGLSGGGLQTLWLSALDTRVSACIVSGYYYGFQGAIMDTVHCMCNYPGQVWQLIDIGELGALIAPRPLVIETGSLDPLNGTGGMDNVYPYVELARGAYRLFGAEESLLHDVFEGVHRWNGQASVEFIKRVMA